MKAVWIDQPGGPEKLYIANRPAPILTPGSIRVHVHATAINRADLLQRRGVYPPPQGESDIMGLEMAGVVSEVASDLHNINVGDRVCALLPGGGYAQEVVVPAMMAAKIPDNMTFEQAAAIPEVFLTAYSNLVWLGNLQQGHVVLIHAGASGVGTAAIQLVDVLGGSSIVTAGTKEKRDACLRLGAKLALDYKEEPFVDQVMQYTNGHGVNLILDFVGGPYLEQNLRSLAMDGKVIIIGTMGGAKADHVNLGLVLSRRLQIIGTALRTRSLEQKIQLTQEFWTFAQPLFERGTLHPLVDRVFSMDEIALAHEYMEDNKNIGKIVVTVN